MDKDFEISSIRLISTIMIVILHIIQKLSYTYSKLEIVSDLLNIGLVMFFCISAFLYSKRHIGNGFVCFLKDIKNL